MQSIQIGSETLVKPQDTLEHLCKLVGKAAHKIDIDTDLNELGLLDSVAMMELIIWLEEKMQLSIPEDEFLPENFRSVRAIHEMVARLIQ